MSLTNTTVTAFFWSTLNLAGNQILSFIISILLARLLTPSDYGLIGIMAVFISIGFLLTESGLTQSIIRQSNPSTYDFSTVFYFNIFASILIYLIIFFLAPLISKFYDIPLLTQLIRIYCLTFIINSFSAIQYTILTKQLEFKKEFLIFIPSILTGGIIGTGIPLTWPPRWRSRSAGLAG